jgi:hypothetical protein
MMPLVQKNTNAHLRSPDNVMQKVDDSKSTVKHVDHDVGVTWRSFGQVWEPVVAIQAETGETEGKQESDWKARSTRHANDAVQKITHGAKGGGLHVKHHESYDNKHGRCKMADGS